MIMMTEITGILYQILCQHWSAICNVSRFSGRSAIRDGHHAPAAQRSRLCSAYGGQMAPGPLAAKTIPNRSRVPDTHWDTHVGGPFNLIFLAALAALYLTLVSESVSDWVPL